MNVPGHPVLSNCGTPTEKASEFFDSHLKTVMQQNWSYKKDPADFINKMIQLGDVLQNTILMTAALVGLYPSIPHKTGLT